MKYAATHLAEWPTLWFDGFMTQAQAKLLDSHGQIFELPLLEPADSAAPVISHAAAAQASASLGRSTTASCIMPLAHSVVAGSPPSVVADQNCLLLCLGHISWQ